MEVLMFQAGGLARAMALWQSGTARFDDYSKSDLTGLNNQGGKY